MADVPAPAGGAQWRWPSLDRLLARPGFQRWAARFPLTRGKVRREGEAIFDVIAGFCHSQILMALLQLGVLERLAETPQRPDMLAGQVGVPVDRLEVLLRAGVALGLLRARRGGRIGVSQRGRALLAVPGLVQMISHHDVLYRDLADPAAFFRGDTTPELAGFWPYVFGGGVPAAEAARYSDLMAQSQLLVADDTLDAVSLRGVAHLMDIGGGAGVFLSEVGKRYSDTRLTLFDLPNVASLATARFAQEGLGARAQIVEGSFRESDLPEGADAISLIRVLYDHSDDTVADLLAKTHAALPPGGRLIISEPMLGGHAPERAGDVYFAVYTLAMGTGKTRSPEQILGLCRAAGFQNVKALRARRPFITSTIVATKGS